jgi:hypothetical protein
LCAAARWAARWSGWILRRTFPASSKVQQAGAHTAPTCGSATCRPRNRPMEIILVVLGPREVGPGPSSTRPSRPPAEPPRSRHTVAALRRSLGGDSGLPRVSGNHPQGMNCRVQPSSQAAQADTPRQQLINLDLACPPDPTAGQRTLTVLTRPRWTPAAAGRCHHLGCRGPVALANEAGADLDGPHRSPEPVLPLPGGGAVVLTGRAIPVPFRPRRLRFATVSHGHF